MDAAEMSTRRARARELHEKTYNCAQCVALVCADLVDLDPNLAFTLCEGLGGGLGCFDQTCGALNGAAVVISKKSCGGMGNPSTKKQTYVHMRKMIDAFREKHGETLCDRLRPSKHNNVTVTCTDYICDAVEMTIAVLESM